MEALPDGDALPSRVMDRVILDVDQTPQRTGWRRWPGGWKRDRLALSATGLAAGMVVLVLGAAFLMPLTTETTDVVPLPGSGSTHRVAQDGSGDFATIAEAVAAADDGDTILVAPGTYTEALVIERDITLRGDGPREDIVITAPEGGPRARIMLGKRFNDTSLYAALLKDSTATLENLTFRGASSVVLASGGSPMLRGLRFDGVDGRSEISSFHGSKAWSQAIIVNGGSTATIEGNSLNGLGGILITDLSDPHVLRNELIGTRVAIMGRGLGNQAIIQDNTIRGGTNAGVLITGPTTALVEGNVISDIDASGILVGERTAVGIDPILRDNIISGSGTAITVSSGARPTIEGNDLTGNTSAIVVVGSDLSITGNDLRDNATGIFVMQGAPLLDGNAITGGAVGLGLGGDRATPSLTGNTICGNQTNVSLTFGAAMPDTIGNDICVDAEDLASQ